MITVQSHEYPLARIISGNEDHAQIDVHYQRGDGSRFWMRVIGEPIVDTDGNRIGATVALIDIDEERRLTAMQDILIAELNHRVKNAFAVTKSIVSQSLRTVNGAGDIRKMIDRRLGAYASAHAKLVGTIWDHASLETVAADVLVPIGGDRVRLSGPLVDLPSRQALAFSIAFYELAANAVQYGALSVPGGSVDVTWELSRKAERLHLDIAWVEQGGPVTKEPVKTGFGSFITQRALQMETGGTTHSAYKIEGYEWHLHMPISEKETSKT